LEKRLKVGWKGKKREIKTVLIVPSLINKGGPGQKPHKLTGDHHGENLTKKPGGVLKGSFSHQPTPVLTGTRKTGGRGGPGIVGYFG